VGTLPNLHYEATITPLSISTNRYITGKESYLPIALININTKIH
jgi:hypothetical protein